MKIMSIIFLFTILSCSTSKDKPKEKEGVIVQSNSSYQDILRFDVDKGHLAGKTVNLIVSYGAIECTCPQWFETKNADDTINGRQHFYLEQGKQGIINTDTLFNGSNFPIQLALTGQFYSKVGYPKNYYAAKGDPKPARVFRYEKIKIIRIGN